MPVTWNDERARRFLRQIFDVAVARADPASSLRQNLPTGPSGTCAVVGAGTAPAAIAAAVDTGWSDVKVSGVVATRYGHAIPARRVRILEAARRRHIIGGGQLGVGVIGANS